jgi:hypothetical protein
LAVFLPQATGGHLSVSQLLSGLTPSATYQVTYELNPWHFVGTTLSCNLVSSYAGVVIDTLTIAGLTASQKGNGVWNQRVINFTPILSSGLLDFSLSCNYINNQKVNGATISVWFNFDQVTLSVVDGQGICSM